MTRTPTVRRELFELAVGYVLVLVAVWTPQPWTRYFFWLGMGWVALVTVLSGESYRLLGLSIEGLKRSWWIVLAAAGIALSAALVAARMHTLHVPPSSTAPRWHAWGYVAWAFVQQFILQDYFLSRLLRICRGKASAVAAATLLFSVAHLPNPVLTLVTIAWGSVSCLLFLRYRDLYSLGLAHAIFGLCLAFTVPNAMHHQMRVGLGYLQYRAPSQPPQRSQVHQMVSTSEWVMAEAKIRCCSRQALP